MAGYPSYTDYSGYPDNSGYALWGHQPLSIPEMIARGDLRGRPSVRRDSSHTFDGTRASEDFAIRSEDGYARMQPSTEYTAPRPSPAYPRMRLPAIWNAPPPSPAYVRMQDPAELTAPRPSPAYLPASPSGDWSQRQEETRDIDGFLNKSRLPPASTASEPRFDAPAVDRSPSSATRARSSSASPRKRQRTSSRATSRVVPTLGFDASSSIVTVTVGATNKEFLIHSDKLRRSSIKFEDISVSHINLPQLDPVAFEIYVHWLYTGRLPSGQVEDEGDGLGVGWLTLTRAFVVGQELVDHRFRDTIMDELRAVALLSETWGTIRNVAHAMVDLVFQVTPEYSPARAFMVDLVQHFDEDWIDVHSDQLPKDFFVKFVLRGGILCHAVRFGQFRLHPCAYHGHPVDEDCYLLDAEK